MMAEAIHNMPKAVRDKAEGHLNTLLTLPSYRNKRDEHRKVLR